MPRFSTFFVISLVIVAVVAQDEGIGGGRPVFFTPDPETGCSVNLASSSKLPNVRWSMCRDSVQLSGEMLSRWKADYSALSTECIEAAPVPGTVLSGLLANDTFQLGTANNTDAVFLDNTLSQIPDINASGREFYTFWYRTDVEVAFHPTTLENQASGSDLTMTSPLAAPPVVHSEECHVGIRKGGELRGQGEFDADGNKQKSTVEAMWLTLRAANYGVEVFVNGGQLKEEGQEEEEEEENQEQVPAVGMFRRRRFRLPFASNPDNGSGGGSLRLSIAILVSPPRHPGLPSEACPLNGTTPCGQGGDHSLAMDGELVLS
jgi:hypothetical protein